MIDVTEVLADAADHPGCRASADGSRVLLTAADGRVVRMYECRGPLDAGLLASQVDQHLRPLEALADEAAARMMPGATLSAFEIGPAAGTVSLEYGGGRDCLLGWWAVGTYTRGLQLIALVAARHCPTPADPTPPREGLSTRARRRQRQQGHS